MSKSHLDNLLRLEKQKVDEFEKEVHYLREQSAAKGADAASFSLIDQLRKVPAHHFYILITNSIYS